MKELAEQTIIKTQVKITFTLFLFLVLGLLFLFLQNFNNTKSTLIKSYSDIFYQRAVSLDQSISQVVNHVSMMRSIANVHLEAQNDGLQLSFNINKFAQASKYFSQKNYHTYTPGEMINHQQIIATIVGHAPLEERDDTYAKIIFMSLDLQAQQKSYQETHSNVVLSYYMSKQQSLIEIFPPMHVAEVIDEFGTFKAWIDHAYNTVYHDISVPQMPPAAKDSAQRIFWTDPYIDLVGYGMMVTCSTPVYNKGVHVGFLSADVVLDFFRQHTEAVALLPGVLAVITNKGKVISATGLNYTNESEFLSISDILPLDTVVADSVHNITVREAAEHLVFAISLNNAPWKYVFVVPKQKVTLAVFNSLLEMALAILLIIIAIPAIFMLVFQKSIKPGIKAEMNLHRLNQELDYKVSERTQELKEREEYNKSLFEKSSIPLVVLSAETSIFTDCNPAAVEIYQFQNKSEVIGKTPLDVSSSTQYDGSDSQIRAYEYLEEAKEKGTIVFEWRHQRPSGETWDAEVQLMSLSLKGESFFQFSLLDISARKRAESERLKLEEQLRQSQKMDAIGQLAGGIAHDFNNMLSAILSSAQLLQLPRFELGKESLKFVNIILNASERAADLTAKLLLFSRKGGVSLQEVNVHDIINDTLAILGKTIDKKVIISSRQKSKNSVVMGDRSELHNLLINMGINASHAMEDGGTLQIDTTDLFLNETYCKASSFNIQPGDYIEIEIRDSGTGIPQENLYKIFDPFFTTKEQGKGTGLGLSAVYGIVQAHHGSINVYSEEGVGTVFHIMLPVAQEGASAQEYTKQVCMIGRGHILLVDDEELIRESGKSTLEVFGYEVTLANNGREAVDIFQDKHDIIDFVILDMIMPEMNGTETFYKLRAIHPGCKVIISSGFTKNENLAELRQNGLVGFISKPFRMIELSSLLSEVIKSDVQGK